MTSVHPADALYVIVLGVGELYILAGLDPFSIESLATGALRGIAYGVLVTLGFAMLMAMPRQTPAVSGGDGS